MKKLYIIGISSEYTRDSLIMLEETDKFIDVHCFGTTEEFDVIGPNSRFEGHELYDVRDNPLPLLSMVFDKPVDQINWILSRMSRDTKYRNDYARHELKITPYAVCDLINGLMAVEGR
jgi:hypothetical protein